MCREEPEKRDRDLNIKAFSLLCSNDLEKMGLFIFVNPIFPVSWLWKDRGQARVPLFIILAFN